MKQAKKAALLSGLILPGLGQLTLKHYKSGFALIATVLTCIGIVITLSVQRAFEVLDKIQTQDGTIDPALINRTVEESTRNSDNILINSAMLILVICWAFGIFHAYTLGKKLDLKESNNS